MDISVRHTGIITHFVAARNFGFIDSGDHHNIFFHFGKRETPPKDSIGRKVKGAALTGYEVEFSVRKASGGANELEAYDLDFIYNTRLEAFIRSYKPDVWRSGFLKKIDSGYYIKDSDTHLFIKIRISAWEIDLDKVYENRVNKLVKFNFEHTPSTNRLIAFLKDRHFNEHYRLLKSAQETGTALTATITGLAKKGYFATFFDGNYTAFVTIPKGYAVPVPYIKGDTISVMVELLSDANFKVKPLKLVKVEGREESQES